MAAAQSALKAAQAQRAELSSSLKPVQKQLAAASKARAAAQQRADATKVRHCHQLQLACLCFLKQCLAALSILHNGCMVSRLKLMR